MKNLKIFIVLFSAAIFIFACSQNSQSVNNTAAENAKTNSNSAPIVTAQATDELASARKIYAEQCVACHKENGTGGVSDIEGKRIKAPNFTSERMKKEPDSEYVEIIEHGAIEDGMPAYKGKISDDDIKNLVKFIRREFQGK